MSLDSVGRAKAESTLTVFNPTTGETVRNNDKTDMTVTVFGEYSDEYKKAFRQRTEKRIEMSQRTGKTSMNYEEIEQETFEMVCLCTKDWNVSDNTGPIPCDDIETVRRIYRDYPWLYRQVRSHMENLSNFLEPSAAT